MYNYPVKTITNGASKIYGEGATDDTLRFNAQSGYAVVVVGVDGVGATATVTADYGNGFSGAVTVAHGEQAPLYCPGAKSLKIAMAGADAEVTVTNAERAEQ